MFNKKKTKQKFKKILSFILIVSVITSIWPYAVAAVPNAPTLYKPFDNILTSDSTYTYKFSATDPDNDDLSYQIQIDDDYAFGTPLVDCVSDAACTTGSGSFTKNNDTDPFTEGENVFFTPTTTMTSGTTYYWRVRAKDATQYGNWSTIFSITYDSSIGNDEWFQTTDEQFNTGTLSGVSAPGNDSLMATSDYIMVSFTSPGTDTFTVPEGVTSVIVKTWGGGGGGGGGGASTYTGGVGGGGGYASAVVSTTASESLNIYVGGGGGGGAAAVSFAGGGGGGGGFSGVKRGTTRLVIAGGGGGGGGGDIDGAGAYGGAGGGSTGGTGGNNNSVTGGGGGGTQIAGGAGGTGSVTAETGSAEQGGAGADGNGTGGGALGGTGGNQGGGAGGTSRDDGRGFAGGGGGGSGIYGGGGGGDSSTRNSDGGSGGGGGPNTLTGTNQTNTQATGASTGGQSDPYYPGSVGNGGSGGAVSSAGSSGQPGAVVILYEPRAMSPEVDSALVGAASWNQIKFSTSEPAGDIKLRLFYTSSSACDTPVPDTALSGNSSGFDVTSSPIDISGLSTSTYDKICLQAAFTSSSGSSPYLENWGVNWDLPALSGVIYQTNESTPYDCSSNNLTVNLKVDGQGSYSHTCTNSSGSWGISDISLQSGEVAYAYISGNTVKGNTVLVSDVFDQTNVNILQNRIVLRDDYDANITNTEIYKGYMSDSDNLISFSGFDITIDTSYETHIYTGDTYTPGANLTTGKLHAEGSYSGASETLTFTASGTGASRPLNIDGGTFNAPTDTIFQGSNDTTIDDQTYNNLSFTPTITGPTSYTFLGSSSVNGNLTSNPTAATSQTLTVNLGGSLTLPSSGTVTLSGTTSGLSNLDTGSGSNYSLSSGILNIGAAGTLNANNSSITLSGATGTIFTRTGTFNEGMSTVNYTLSETSPTLTLTSGDITFYNLKVQPTANNISAPFGSGTLTVNGDLTIGNGTNTNIEIETDTNDPNLSVLGSVTVSASTTFTNSDNPSATLNIDNNLINNGTFTAPSGTENDSFTLGGSFTNSGTFNHSSGKITLDTTKACELDYAADTTFNQFYIGPESAGKKVKFDETYTTVISDDFTIQGAGCGQGRIYLSSLVNGNAWDINLQVGTTFDIDYIDLEDASAFSSDLIPIAENSNTTGTNIDTWVVNTGVCSPAVKFKGVTLQGTRVH